MGGYFPGIPGFVAFAGVKFGGYCLAGVALKKLQPTISASVAKIAGARTGLGILIGLPVMIGSSWALANAFPRSSQEDFPNYAIYGVVYILRILIWALVINIFTKQIGLPKLKLWSYAAMGALWSCFLDLPGFGLAIIAPGKIPIC
jgi:hypothetical protein